MSRWLAKPSRGPSDKEPVRVRGERIRFVFQSADNRPSALKAPEQLELAARILEHHPDSRPATLSGGPNLLLVEEATDAPNRNRAHEIIQLLLPSYPGLAG